MNVRTPVTYRMNEAERALIEDAAKASDLTVSAWARQTLLREARKVKSETPVPAPAKGSAGRAAKPKGKSNG